MLTSIADDPYRLDNVITDPSSSLRAEREVSRLTSYFSIHFMRNKRNRDLLKRFRDESSLVQYIHIMVNDRMLSMQKRGAKLDKNLDLFEKEISLLNRYFDKEVLNDVAQTRIVIALTHNGNLVFSDDERIFLGKSLSEITEKEYPLMEKDLRQMVSKNARKIESLRKKIFFQKEAKRNEMRVILRKAHIIDEKLSALSKREKTLFNEMSFVKGASNPHRYTRVVSENKKHAGDKLVLHRKFAELKDRYIELLNQEEEMMLSSEIDSLQDNILRAHVRGVRLRDQDLQMGLSSELPTSTRPFSEILINVYKAIEKEDKSSGMLLQQELHGLYSSKGRPIISRILEETEGSTIDDAISLFKHFPDSKEKIMKSIQSLIEEYYPNKYLSLRA